jgi:hypothetical protein
LLIFRDATVEHARRVDLTAFAEVVAHDLRNPLAAVESWTEMMAAELEHGGVETGLLEEYIDRVGSGTRRMTVLIEDLLGRATQDAALQLRRVDVATLAEEVAADHGATEQVKVGYIPEVRADAALVRQVLDNLLGNALKFVAPGDEPRITVTGRRTDSGTVGDRRRRPGRRAAARGRRARLRGAPPRPPVVRRTRAGARDLPPGRRAARWRHHLRATTRPAGVPVFELTLPVGGLTCAPCSRSQPVRGRAGGAGRSSVRRSTTARRPRSDAVRSCRIAANAVTDREDTTDDEVEYLRRAPARREGLRRGRVGQRRWFWFLRYSTSRTRTTSTSTATQGWWLR